jgi:hypothetical protein
LLRGEILEQTTLSPEKEKILAYIYKYGNTQSNDLVNYGTSKLNLPQKKVKDLLADMILYGELKQVIHEELSPPIVYFKQGETAILEMQMQAMSMSMGLGRLSREEMNATHEILCKAAEDAEKKLKEKYGVESKIILAQAKEAADKHHKKIKEKSKQKRI